MYKVNLSQLIRGSVFTLFYIVSNYKLGIKTFILINIKANSFVFVNTKFAKTACQFLSLEKQLLRTPYHMHGFDSQKANLITEYLKATLIINKRQ